MKRSRYILSALMVSSFAAGTALAQETDHEGNTREGAGHIEYNPEKPHHLSVVIGGTNIPSANETAFTLGIDYEYRVNRRLGLGFVVEQAFDDIDATTLLAVADIHLWRGLALQVGPGVEFLDEGEEHETFAIGRIGALYEIEFGEGYTISPQFHYDISSGEDAIVFGVAIGRAF